MNNKYADFSYRLNKLVTEKQVQLGHKLTQEELSKAFDCKQSFVSQMVTGQKLPSMETAIALCDYFDCCLDWLLRGVGNIKPGKTFTIYDQIDESSLTPSQKNNFKALLFSLIEEDKQ